MEKAEYTRVILDSSIITASSGGPGFANSFKFSGFWDGDDGNASFTGNYGEISETTEPRFFESGFSTDYFIDFLNEHFTGFNINRNTYLLDSDGSYLGGTESESMIESLFGSSTDFEDRPERAEFLNREFEWVAEKLYFRVKSVAD